MAEIPADRVLDVATDIFDAAARKGFKSNGFQQASLFRKAIRPQNECPKRGGQADLASPRYREESPEPEPAEEPDEAPEPDDAGADEPEPSPELDPDFEAPESEFPELEPEEELDAVSEDELPEFELPDDVSEPEFDPSPEAGLAAEAEDSTGSPPESLREDALFDPEGFLLA